MAEGAHEPARDDVGHLVARLHADEGQNLGRLEADRIGQGVRRRRAAHLLRHRAAARRHERQRRGYCYRPAPLHRVSPSCFSIP